MITQEELNKLQKLAKLTFSQDEMNKFSQRLNNVLSMIELLKEVDCQNQQPLRSVCDMHQRFREDAVNSGDNSEILFANVPASNAKFAKEVKCFIVPKIVE